MNLLPCGRIDALAGTETGRLSGTAKARPDFPTVRRFAWWRLGFWLLALLCAATPVRADGPGTIYFVLGSDTAIWNAPGGIDITTHTNHFTTDLYTSPSGRAYQVMDPAFRTPIVDSFGNTLKLTWWMLVGSVYGSSDNQNTPVPNLMPLHLMLQYHGAALKQWGDEVTLHYHTFLWSDYTGAGVYYWNQSKTFHECRADFDKAVAQSLIEEGVYTVTFRSGWHYMDNEWQAYCDELWPFNMDNDSPNESGEASQPFFNVLNWSKAPLDFVPFHPATTNYQVPGDGTGWNVRSMKTPNVTQATVDGIFASAAAGTNEVVSFWAHLPEGYFLTEMQRMNQLIQTSASNNPAIQFRYCTSIEAMRLWMGSDATNPPALDVVQTTNGNAVTLTIATDGPIYQAQPYIALKDTSENYRVVPAFSAGSNKWRAQLPLPLASLAKVGIAVTDSSGNLATRILRYVPDDLYVDNLDSTNYSEPAGNWSWLADDAAWATGASVAQIPPGGAVSARWTLPVTETRPYAIYVQAPALSNSVSSVQYELRATGDSVTNLTLPAPFPAHQWVYLTTAALDPAVTNTLVLTAVNSGAGTNAIAADVVRVTPFVEPKPFIQNVATDAGSTTANIVWTTPTPTPTVVEYGEDLRYGKFSASNGVPATTHVVTLTGLTPSTIYQFMIDAPKDAAVITQPGQFTTTNSVAGPAGAAFPVLPITNTWKFSCSNLDGVAWTAPAYDDSAWPSGPGLLWVDTRPGGPDTNVQPKGYQLPDNPATGLPYITYYFRTRFNFQADPSGAILVFTNYIDDGAIWYLNGAEIARNNMSIPLNLVSNWTLATRFNCGGDAICPVAFKISGSAATNLVAGDNVLAVEVHNYSADSPDITFGTALWIATPTPYLPRLSLIPAGETAILDWNGDGFTLQQSPVLGAPVPWTDVPGPVTNSPFSISPRSAGFFRLRK